MEAWRLAGGHRPGPGCGGPRATSPGRAHRKDQPQVAQKAEVGLGSVECTVCGPQRPASAQTAGVPSPLGQPPGPWPPPIQTNMRLPVPAGG